MDKIPNMNRRRVLIGIAAASTAAAPVALAAAVPMAENPALFAAYDELRAARAERDAATDALEWLADEWRHRWPLAPEEILGGWNAHRCSSEFSSTVERDILGRPLMRDCVELTKRLNRKDRQGRNCFHVDAPDRLTRRLAHLQATEPVGRTAKTLASNQAARAKYIARLEKQLPLSCQYYAETQRLREASGAEAATMRVKDANAAVQHCEAKIGEIPAFTMAGISIKAAVLKEAYEHMGIHGLGGIVGDGYRLAASIIDAQAAGGVS